MEVTLSNIPKNGFKNLWERVFSKHVVDIDINIKLYDDDKHIYDMLINASCTNL